jgi:heme/copper-type cytochrome/quinol oxidase subunit 2
MDEQTAQYKPVTLGDWMITMLICAIPLVGLIMLFVWGFSGSTHPSKANWAKAVLIWAAIALVFYIIVFVILGVFAGMSGLF